MPITFCHDMNSIISNYWWGGCDNRRKIHWVSWDTLCLLKSKGGLGFRNMAHFNYALLAKQGLRLLHNNSSLVARVLKGRYYPRTSFMQARLGHNCSYTWRSLMGARHILTDGCIWHIGDGSSVNIWEDRWLSCSDHKRPITPPPTDQDLHKIHCRLSYMVPYQGLCV